MIQWESVISERLKMLNFAFYRNGNIQVLGDFSKIYFKHNARSFISQSTFTVQIQLLEKLTLCLQNGKNCNKLLKVWASLWWGMLSMVSCLSWEIFEYRKSEISFLIFSVTLYGLENVLGLHLWKWRVHRYGELVRAYPIFQNGLSWSAWMCYIHFMVCFSPLSISGWARLARTGSGSMRGKIIEARW